MSDEKIRSAECCAPGMKAWAELKAQNKALADALSKLVASAYNDGEDDCMTILVTPQRLERMRRIAAEAASSPDTNSPTEKKSGADTRT